MRNRKNKPAEKKMTAEEVRQSQLQMLDKIDAFCKENGLDYFLDAGTLLGAIRHKGYIPWDDDVDIGMPRADYEKLLERFHIEGYSLKTPYNDKNYYYPFAKLCDDQTILYEKTAIDTNLGIYIDIFPFDTVQEASFKRYFRKQMFLRHLIGSQFSIMGGKRSFYKRMLLAVSGKIFAHIDLNKIAVRIDSLIKQYTDPNGPYTGPLTWFGKTIQLVDRQVIENFSTTEFEGRQYSIPTMYDAYLTALYGDYMKLPPVEERVSHGYDAYWK